MTSTNKKRKFFSMNREERLAQMQAAAKARYQAPNQLIIREPEPEYGEETIATFGKPPKKPVEPTIQPRFKRSAKKKIILYEPPLRPDVPKQPLQRPPAVYDNKRSLYGLND